MHVDLYSQTIMYRIKIKINLQGLHFFSHTFVNIVKCLEFTFIQRNLDKPLI